MKAIVFGGSGFVGSHVAEALVEAGHDVTIYDQKPSRYLQKTQRMVIGDILNSDQVEQAIRGHDVVYNFAGLADLDEGLVRPVDTVYQNVLGNTIILDASCRQAIRRYVFASTIYVYSEAGGFYRVSKQAAELYIEEYQRRHGLDYTILRYGTLYGRRANSNNSIHRYLTQALLNREVIYYGNGEEEREYIHVEDAARSSVDILAEEFKNQYVILAGHFPMKVKDLLVMIQEIVGADVKVDFRPISELGPSQDAHYSITPYSFRPKIGKKLVRHLYLDMGQGILDCLGEIYEQHGDTHGTTGGSRAFSAPQLDGHK